MIQKRIFTLLTIILVISMTATISSAAQSVLIVLTSHDQLGETDKKTGFWLSELTHPYYTLKDAGYEIDIASIKGGVAPIDPGSLDKKDPVNQRYFKDSELKNKVATTQTLANVAFENYGAILFSGGHGTMWDFPQNKDVQRLATAIFENNGVVAAVCHGSAALIDVKLTNGKYLVEGKRISAFTNEEESLIGLTQVVPFSLEDKLDQRGANLTKAAPWQAMVSVDGRVVTGQNPQSAHEVGNEMIKLLKQ